MLSIGGMQLSALKIQDYRQLSGNTLKLIAAVAMLIDHVGYILLPQYRILRYIGEISPVRSRRTNTLC